jgi:hypothetical protein
MIKHQFYIRRAVSLTELLFVLSMCTLILSMCGVLLQRVMRVESSSRAFNDSERACVRLSHQLRNDIHRAVGVDLLSEMPTAGPFLRLQQPDNVSVEYTRESNNIHLTVRKAENVVARDEFALPPLARLTINRLKSPERIVLLIAPPPLDAATDTDRQLQSYRAIPLGVQVEATLRQLQTTKEQG